MDDTTLLGFKALTTFVLELSSMFGEKHRPLKLYAHLLGKTTLAHDKAIRKHTDSYLDFCIKNRDAIYNKDVSVFATNTITYSSKAYIDIKKIISMADKDTKDIIWAHLLTISAILDTDGQAKQILKELPKKKDTNLSLSSLLGPLMSVMGSNAGESSDPNAIINNLLSGGGLEAIISAASSFSKNAEHIDTGSLIKTLSDTFQTLNKDGTAAPMIDSITKKIQSVSTRDDTTSEDMKSIVSSLLSTIGVDADTSEKFCTQIQGIATSLESKSTETTVDEKLEQEKKPVTIVDRKKED